MHVHTRGEVLITVSRLLAAVPPPPVLDAKLLHLTWNLSEMTLSNLGKCVTDVMEGRFICHRNHKLIKTCKLS